MSTGMRKVYGAVVLLLTAGMSFAASTGWQHDPNTPGDWFDSNNWTNGVPSTGLYNAAYIGNGGTVRIDSGSAECYSLKIKAGTDNTLIQTGGELRITGSSGIRIGTSFASGHPRYELHDGNLVISHGSMILYLEGNAVFEQTGGLFSISGQVVIGQGPYTLSSRGQYLMTGGVFEAGGISLSMDRGRGELIQTGGTVTATNLLLGSYLVESEGYYELRDGQLSAEIFQVGATGSGEFVQSGGTATISRLLVIDTGTYRMTGGRLEIVETVQIDTAWDFGGLPATIAAGPDTFNNFANTTFVGASATTMTAGVNSVTVFPSGFDPYVDFASYHSDGLTHISGTPMTIAAGMTVTISGEIPDHVIVHGTLRNTPGVGLKLKDGVEVYAGGSVAMQESQYGNSVTVNDTVSGVFGGDLSTRGMGIGTTNDAQFTHDGGNVSLVQLNVGTSYPGSSSKTGSYDLRNGTLTGWQLTVGSPTGGGSARYVQSGGQSDFLFVYARGSGNISVDGGNFNAAKFFFLENSTYEQSDGNVTLQRGNNPPSGVVGQLETQNSTVIITGGSLTAEMIYVRSGTVIHSGGTVSTTTKYGLNLVGSSTYELSGTGHLSTDLVSVEASHGLFQQSGGILSAKSMQIAKVSATGESKYLLSAGSGTVEQMVVGSGYDTYDGYAKGGVVQSGGDLLIEHLRITDKSSFTLTGGALTITDSVDCDGSFAFGGGNASMTAGGIIDLSSIPFDAGSTTFHLDANSLLIVPAGFVPGTDFGSFTSNGIVAQSGTDIVIPAGRTVIGRGTVREHLVVLGTIEASVTAGISVQGGLEVGPSGSAEFQQGEVVILDSTSGMTGGNLAGALLQIGKGSGDVRFEQINGNMAPDQLHVAVGVNGRSTYVLQGGELRTGTTTAGTGGWGDVYAEGRIEQYGGVHATTTLYLGKHNGNHGHYLLAGGELNTRTTYVGYNGTSVFVQTGGVHNVTDWLWISGGGGYWAKGRYELRNGVLHTKTTELYASGELTEFVQSGGVHVASTRLSNAGQYYMEGGDLSTPLITLYAGGQIIQSGGSVTVDTVNMTVNYFENISIIYQLSGGRLTVGKLLVQIGNSTCAGRFIQTGGDVVVSERVEVGSSGDDAYVISGGTLVTPELKIGIGGSGAFNITGAGADLTVTDRLVFGARGTFTAVPGATIHVSGTALENESTDSSALAGLENLHLVVKGGGTTFWSIEVAGQDFGQAEAGLHDNFALDTLETGIDPNDPDDAGGGHIKLVDEFDNQPGWEGTDALYVRHLILNDWATLDLNGKNLYYLYFHMGQGVTLYPQGGQLLQIPEPATLVLLGIAAPLVLRRKSRRS